MLTITNKLRARFANRTRRLGRRMLALVACFGTSLGITACTNDATRLTCKDLNSNPAALDAMAKVAISNPALSAYVNPTNNFGGGGQEAIASGIDAGGLTTEFKNQVTALCAGASPNTQPYQTALGNTGSFARTGARTPAPSGSGTSDANQGRGAAGGGSISGQGSGESSGGSSSLPASASQSSGPGGGSAQPPQHTPVCDPNEPHYPCTDQSSGQLLTGPPNGSSGTGSSAAVDNGSSGSQSSGSGGTGPDSGASGGSGSSSSGSGNLNLPPCGPPNCNW